MYEYRIDSFTGSDGFRAYFESEQEAIETGKQFAALGYPTFLLKKAYYSATHKQDMYDVVQRIS